MYVVVDFKILTTYSKMLLKCLEKISAKAFVVKIQFGFPETNFPQSKRKYVTMNHPPNSFEEDDNFSK